MPKLFVTPKKNPRKIWILSVIIFVLLAAGAGGYYYWSSTQKASPANEDASIKKVNDDELATEINTLIDEKNYDKAQKLIEYQDNSKSDPSKLVMLAEVSVKKGDTDGALKMLSTAATSDTKNAYYFKGHEARILADTGDTQNALARYQEAIDLAGKVTGSTEQEALLIAQRIGDYEYAVNELKGAQ